MRRSPEHGGSSIEYALPTIISCTNLGRAGDIMSITGRNFGNGEKVMVSIGASQCLRPVLKEFHTRISCQIPEKTGKSGTNLPVRVCIAGQWSAEVGNLAAFFSYKGKFHFPSQTQYASGIHFVSAEPKPLPIHAANL
jgi:hypothetical protein